MLEIGVLDNHKKQLKILRKQHKGKLIFIELFGDNCNFCIPQQKALEHIEALYGDFVAIYKLRIDEKDSPNYHFANELGVRMMPTTLVFNNEKRKFLLPGLTQPKDLERIVNISSEKGCFNCKFIDPSKSMRKLAHCKKYDKFVDHLLGDNIETTFFCKKTKQEIKYQESDLASKKRKNLD